MFRKCNRALKEIKLATTKRQFGMKYALNMNILIKMKKKNCHLRFAIA